MLQANITGFFISLSSSNNNNNNNNNNMKCCCLDTRCAFPCDKDVPCTLACCLFTCMVNGNLSLKCCAKVGDLTGESTKKVVPKK